MSYDIMLRKPACPECGHVDSFSDLPEPTYNLTPIFDFALTGEPLPNPEVGEGSVVIFHKETDRPRGLRLLNGKKASETTHVLSQAIMRMETASLATTFRELQPTNGWGTVEGAYEVLTELRKAAILHPDHVWEVH